MNDKILVAYASRAGSTAGVAEAIGKTLAEGGAQVDVRPMQEVKDLTPYTAVVAGSAIQGGQWLPEAIQFIQTHRTALVQKPFAAFLVCMTLSMPKADKYRQGVAEWMAPVRALVQPVSEGLFAGVLDNNTINQAPTWFGRLAFRLTLASGLWWKQGDHRDWEAIHAWTADLKPRLERAMELRV